MSQENVEIVQGLYAALNREDLDAVFEHIAPEFELDWSRVDGWNRCGREAWKATIPRLARCCA